MLLLDDDELARRRGDALHANLPDAERVACGRRLLIEPERIVGLVATQTPTASAQVYADDWRAWTVGDELLITLDDGSFAPRKMRRPGGTGAVDNVWKGRHGNSSKVRTGSSGRCGRPTPLERARCAYVCSSGRAAASGTGLGGTAGRGLGAKSTRGKGGRADFVFDAPGVARVGPVVSHARGLARADPRLGFTRAGRQSRAHRVGATQACASQLYKRSSPARSGPRRIPSATTATSLLLLRLWRTRTTCPHRSRNPNATDVPAWRRFTMSAVFDEPRRRRRPSFISSHGCVSLSLTQSLVALEVAGAERGLRESQASLNPLCDRVRATQHAPRDPCRLLERRHGLADIVECGVVRPCRAPPRTPTSYRA